MVSFNEHEHKLRMRIAHLETQVAALQKVEERSTIALAQSSIGLFDWDLANRTIYLSPVLQDMLGYAGLRMPADIERWRWHLHCEDLSRAEKQVREALKHGREEFQAAYRIRRLDDSLRVFLFRAVLLRRHRDEDGDAVRAVGAAIDLTEAFFPLRGFLGGEQRG